MSTILRNVYIEYTNLLQIEVKPIVYFRNMYIKVISIVRA